MDKLEVTVAPGQERINLVILTERASTLSLPLWKIFSEFLEIGQIPHVWKQANITPIYKKGSMFNYSTTNPVSLTWLKRSGQAK